MNTQPNRVYTIEDITDTLKAWFQLVLVNKTSFSIIFLAGGFSGFLYAHYVKKIIYKSRVTFVIDKQSVEPEEASLLHYTGINVSGNPSPKLLNGDNLRLILQSEFLLKEALISPSSSLDGNNLFSLIWKESDVPLIGFSRDIMIKKFIKTLQKEHLLVGKIEDMGSFYFIEMNHENELFSFHFPEKLFESLLNFYENEKIRKLNMDMLAIRNRSTDLNKEIVLIRNRWFFKKSQSRNLVHFEDQILLENLKKRLDELELKLKINQELLDIASFQRLRKISFINLIDKPLFPLEYKGKNRLKHAFIFGILYFLVAFIFYLNQTFKKAKL